MTVGRDGPKPVITGTIPGLTPTATEALFRRYDQIFNAQRPSPFTNSLKWPLRYEYSETHQGVLRAPHIWGTVYGASENPNRQTFFEADNKHAIQVVAGAYQASIGITFSVKRTGGSAAPPSEQTVFVFGDRTQTFWTDGNGFSASLDTTGGPPFSVRVYKHVAGVRTQIGTFTITEDYRAEYIDVSSIIWTLSDPMKFMVSVNGVYLTFSVAGLAMASGGYLGLHEPFRLTGTEHLFKGSPFAVSALNALSESVLNVGASKVGVLGDYTFIANLLESGGKAINRLYAKALAGDADSADSIVVGALRDVVKLTALTSGEVDFSKAGVLNRVAANLLRQASGATLQAIVANLTDASHAAAAMQESGGKAVNRLLAKALAGDADSLDGTPDGTTYKKVAGVSAGNLIQTASIADAQVTTGKLADFSRAKVYHSTSQSISSGSATALAWDSETFDVGGLHDTATNNSRITVPSIDTRGTWMLLGQVEWNSLPSGTFTEISIRKNGTTVLGRVQDTGQAASKVQQVVAFDSNPIAGDYYEVLAFQTSGAGQTVNGTNAATSHFHCCHER